MEYEDQAMQRQDNDVCRSGKNANKHQRKSFVAFTSPCVFLRRHRSHDLPI